MHLARRLSPDVARWALARRAALVALAAVSLGCGGEPTARDRNPPAVVRAITGNDQQAAVGTTLATPLVVEVLDWEGAPVGGVTVTFAVDGGGTTSPTTATTDATGQARTTLTLGHTAGDHIVHATVGALPQVRFSAIARPGAPTQLTVVSGDAQTGTVGLYLGPTVLRVLDAWGNGVYDVPLAATPLPGNGAFSGGFAFDAPATDATGSASGRWQLGGAVGPQRLTVTATSAAAIAPLTLSATAVAGPAATITVVGGNAQSDTAGAPLATPLAVRVVDSFGNPVAGYDVGFTATAGGGSTTTARTDASGLASAVWTLGTTVGAQTAKASIVVQWGSGTATRPPEMREVPVQFDATASAP